TTIFSVRPDSPGANRNPDRRKIFTAYFREHNLLVAIRDPRNLDGAPPRFHRRRRCRPGKSDRLNPLDVEERILDPLRIVCSLFRVVWSLKREAKNGDVLRVVAKRRTSEHDKGPQRCSGSGKEDDSRRTLDQCQETMSACRSSCTNLASAAHTGNQPRT